MELKQPIKIRKEARPVFLPNKDSDKNMYDGKETANLLVSGWGLTKRRFKPNRKHKSRRLKSVTVPSVSAKECKKAYKKELKRNMICAGMVGTGRLDACQGDSGGPMVWLDSERVELIGLTSGGKGCALSKYPGVYARITYVLDWVKKNTNDCNQKTCQKDNCMTKSKLISDVVERFQTISATDYTTTTTTPAYPCFGENPCENGGTCSTGADGFAHCDCVPECSGKRCEDCEPCYLLNPCKNGGTCSPGADGSAHCDCVPECSGERCEDCEPCFINPCKNGGTCYQDYIEGVVNEACFCPPRCSGERCEDCDPCPEEVKCKDHNRIGARIVGGCQVERNTFPWHVSVIMERRINEEQVANYAYGGTILCPTLIMTAAYAITNCGKKLTCDKNYCKPAPATNVKVWVGKHKSYPDPDGDEYKVSIVIPHPKWAFKQDSEKCHYRDAYDLAILKLARPIDLRTGSKAAAVYLPDINNPTQGLVQGHTSVASGWGQLKYIKDYYLVYDDDPKALECKAEKLNAVKLSEIGKPHTINACQRKYRGNYDETIMMCMGQKDYPETPTKGACWHDRGGPLVTLNKFTDEVQLIGVNSFGNYYREDCTSAPSVFTDLINGDWLRDWEIDFGDGFTKNVTEELIRCNKRACAAEQCMKGKDLDPFVKSYFFD